MSRTHRYKGLRNVIEYYGNGDGYDAKERHDVIYNKCKHLIDKAYTQGRADAIEELAKDTIDKINFEEKWLSDCKSNNADTSIVFNALRSFVKMRCDL